MEGKRLQSKVISSSAVNTGDQSPERTRRKGKWATERQAPGDVDAVHERLAETEDGKRRRRLQDPLPLEDATDVANDRFATHLSKRNKPDISANNLPPERVINPEYVPRSGYFFEHDDRSPRRPRQNFKWEINRLGDRALATGAGKIAG
ncbi:hypothetical protein O6H91_09G055300 [Diphasiastrum complanatum]|uniref:Uncharacterized protein n=1 Tax=Diphasiastrum complanatum TaxID=34168 RepID=A0ACC2CPG5_DIPCM|nr:hypothetical protein O6H91_09G055300 [Diphasiastrum complanatum]